MIDQPERFSAERLPLWIPLKAKDVLLATLKKEPIDLKSKDAVQKHFVCKAEIEDVYDVIRQVEKPILIGIYGSRADLSRPPLFESEQSFDLYHNAQAGMDGSLESYLEQESLTLKDYQTAREILQHGFNENYINGKKYPEQIVKLLVRDIDLLIIAEGRHIRGGPHVGKRTNVPMDISANSPYNKFESDPEDLENYLKQGVAQATPLKY